MGGKMSLDKRKIKIRENKAVRGLEGARFALSYGMPTSMSSVEYIRESSYEILSSLKSDSDVLIEINSSLFNIPRNQRDSFVTRFIDTIRDLGLEFRYRKVPSADRPSLLSIIFGKKGDNQAHEVVAYVPNNVWQQDNFKSVFPLCGARYYVIDEELEPSKTLDDVCNMLDSEKLERFKLIIFDSGLLGSMGINSLRLEMKDIKHLLGI
jgi:hypothetical protein